MVCSGERPMRKQHGIYLQQKRHKNIGIREDCGIIGIKALDFKDIRTVIARRGRA